MSNLSGNVYSTDLKLPATPQVDEKKYPDIYYDLINVHQAVRTLQYYLDAYVGAAIVCKAAVAINVGRFVHITTGYTDVAAVVLADSSTKNNPCNGFATSAGVGNEDGINIQTFGIWPYGNGSLVPGTAYYLSTGGGITVTPPVGAGKLVQYIGTAIDTSNILIRPAGKYTEL